MYGSAPLLGEATKLALRNRIGSFDILFLSTHGRFDPDAPLFSSIDLQADTESDGRLRVHEVYDLRLHGVDLVVLAGCETQLGEQDDGDDVVGLSRAFLYSGSGSVLASLWTVREMATQELMVMFFSGFKAGQSRAMALKEAERAVRQSHPSPFYWASFVLTG
jgi:CHAT domain-containing protein